MKKFIVERILPGAGNLSPEEVQSVARSCCESLYSMAKPYHWIQSFITEDKIYCIYIANDVSDIREHARHAQMPIHSVSEVMTVIDPTNANTEVSIAPFNHVQK
jgi:hypothetical protein